MAGSALIGMPLVTVGVASANPAPSHGHSAPSKNCDTTGSASNSPGVASGNVVQVPVLNCSDVFGSPSAAVTGPFITAPAGTP
ncbi:DUF320 domain-containing protein [Actinomycetospora sp. TBRC 11914]|nr:DUF320 domain-containing protein [Actinomycetospora sp. TBRC 11914]